jgi:hypothetical protein
VSKRSRRCKNGYRNVSRSLVAPNPGVVSKMRGKPAFPRFVARNVGWHRGRERNRGKVAPARAAGCLVETANREDYLPCPVRIRTTRCPKPNRKRPDLSLSLYLSIKISFPAQSFVSRSKHRLAPVHHIWIPPFSIFFVVLLCRGDAVATVNKNTPYFCMTDTFSRPK